MTSDQYGTRGHWLKDGEFYICVLEPEIPVIPPGDYILNRYFSEKHALDRAFLHCGHLEIDHPDTGARHIIEAPLAGDLRAVLERISGPGTLRFLDLKNAFGTGGAPPNPSPPGEG